MLRGLIAGLVVLLPAATARAADVAVMVRDFSAGQRCLSTAVVIAVPEDAPSAKGIEQAVRDDRVSLTLDDDQPWTIRARAPRCWSTTVTWSALRQAQ